jgi:hypothetical protein
MQNPAQLKSQETNTTEALVYFPTEGVTLEQSKTEQHKNPNGRTNTTDIY